MAAGSYTRGMGHRDRKPEEPGHDADDVELDLDERACPTCRRDLAPWHSECPDCHEPAVLRFGLPPAVPPPPAHLVDEDPRAASPEEAGESADGAALIDRALEVTTEEVRQPTDDVDGPPQPPPVGGDPFVG